MEPLDDVDDNRFEDYSVSSELERLTFQIEQAVEKWHAELLARQTLTGQVQTGHGQVCSAAQGFCSSTE